MSKKKAANSLHALTQHTQPRSTEERARINTWKKKPRNERFNAHTWEQFSPSGASKYAAKVRRRNKKCNT